MSISIHLPATRDAALQWDTVLAMLHVPPAWWSGGMSGCGDRAVPTGLRAVLSLWELMNIEDKGRLFIFSVPQTPFILKNSPALVFSSSPLIHYLLL